MAQRCSSCERTALAGYSRSHSNVATKRRMKLNLQSRTINGRRVLLCTSCIKTLQK